jgi:hypothetical protein
LDKEKNKDGSPAVTGFFDIGSGIGNTLGTAAILTKRAKILGMEFYPQRAQYSELLKKEMEDDAEIASDIRSRFKDVTATAKAFTDGTEIDPAMTHWYAFDAVMSNKTKEDIVKQFNSAPHAKMLVTTQAGLDKLKGDAL